MGLIGSLIKVLIRYILPVIISIIVIINVTLLLAFPVRLNPEMPHLLRLVAVGTPLVSIVGSIGVYMYTKEKKHLKYGIPIAIITPWLVLGISWLFLLPTVAASLIIDGTIGYVVLPVAVVFSLIIIRLLGVNGEKPWSLRGNELSEEEYSPPSRVYSSVTSDRVLTGGFRIIESPEGRIQKDEVPEQSKLWEPYEGILRSMMVAGVPLIYRLVRIYGRTREYYLTLGRGWVRLQSNIRTLQSALSANLPEYRLEKTTRLEETEDIDPRQMTLVTLTGEPLRVDDSSQRSDPLTVVARALMKQRNGILQTVALPVSSGLTRSLKRTFLGRKYKAKASQAQVSVTRESSGILSRGKQETAVYTDMIETEKADRVRRELDRHSASNACEVEISVACWSREESTHSQMLMDILRGAIRPADSLEDFRTRVRRGGNACERVVEGRPVGDYTLLLPIEAAGFFTLPQTDLGTSIVKRSAFSTSTSPMPDTPPRQSEPTTCSFPSDRRVYAQWRNEHQHQTPLVALGNILSPSGEPLAGQIVWFPTQKFESHFGIYGNVRSGKTWTALQIVAQAMKGGCRTTILVPRRARDWTRLIYLQPDLNIFTAGNPDTSPLRINMFAPPENVPLSIWMKTLVKVFSGLLPNDRVMSLHFDDVVHTVYRNCGWDRATNVYGRPILLSDLWDAMEEVSSNLLYGDELKSNFYGALYTRLSSMMRNNTIVDMYNTTGGMTWEYLATHNVLIDMEYLPDEDRSFLMSLLAAGLHRYKMFNPSRRIENLLIIEEASYILRRSEGQDFYGPNASETVLSLMIDMFTTCGGNGLGTVTIEQLPSRLADEIVKLIVNVITHAIGDESERRIIAGHIGIDERRIDHLQQMRKGEIIAYFEGEGVPKNAQMWPLDKLLKSPLPDEPVTPEWIREHMRPVYEAHPDLSSSVPLPADIIDRIERVASSDGAPTDRILPVPMTRPEGRITGVSEYEQRIDRKLHEIVQRPRFVKHLAERVEQARDGEIEPLVQLVIDLAESLKIERAKKTWVAERLLRHSADCYPSLLDPELVGIILMVIRGVTP